MTKKRTKQILKIVFIAASLGSLYFVPWLLVKAWVLPLPDTLQEQADEAVENGFEGVIFYVDQEGQAPQMLASGWHNRETKTPANPHALFKIASISKLYDAVAVTKLVSEGRLSLDKSLAEYLPDLANRIENADKITLRWMIQHRSGIPNYTDTYNFWASPTQSYEESLALILDKPAIFDPGEDYEYCNTNYLLINMIMDNVLTYGNSRYIKEKILIPLNLNHTFGSLSEANLDELMSGYHLGHPYDLKGDDLGMVASAEDVGVFIRALNDGSVFDTNEQEIYSSLYKYEHSGWVPGYQSFAKYHEELDAVTVEFYSTTDSDLLYWNLSQIINGRVVDILQKQKTIE